ncbi:MAG: SDR family NAD(P)-dependent oxidoreductase [Halioglobus sp.]|nr:SDR family NAD(P)-dependent oxidoreductase [Halioglobus sp.]
MLVLVPGPRLWNVFWKAATGLRCSPGTAERLEELAATHKAAYAFPCDVADREALEKTVQDINEQLGAPRIVIHNAVGGAFGNFQDIELDLLEKNFRINTVALLQLARLTIPKMIGSGGGALICTGNTSAYRGKAQFSGFAPTKAAQRILLESIARASRSAGVHVAYLATDAVIDLPWTRKAFPDKPDSFFCKPIDIAEECFHLAHQRPSAWAFEVMIRPYGEAW